jgi:hypothetical protein
VPELITETLGRNNKQSLQHGIDPEALEIMSGRFEVFTMLTDLNSNPASR